MGILPAAHVASDQAEMGILPAANVAEALPAPAQGVDTVMAQLMASNAKDIASGSDLALAIGPIRQPSGRNTEDPEDTPKMASLLDTSQYGSENEAASMTLAADNNTEAREIVPVASKPTKDRRAPDASKPTKDTKAVASQRVSETLEQVLATTGDSTIHFNRFSENLHSAADRLLVEFKNQRLRIAELFKETKHLKHKRAEMRAQLMEQLEDFKKRTLSKLTELQSEDARLESVNSKLKAKNEELRTRVVDERARKETLVQKLQRMAGLFKHQSAQVQDLVQQRKRHLEDEVSNTLHDALNAMEGEDPQDKAKVMLPEPAH